jgi:hypothetical protein
MGGRILGVVRIWLDIGVVSPAHGFVVPFLGLWFGL